MTTYTTDPGSIATRPITELMNQQGGMGAGTPWGYRQFQMQETIAKRQKEQQLAEALHQQMAGSVQNGWQAAALIGRKFFDEWRGRKKDAALSEQLQEYFAAEEQERQLEAQQADAKAMRDRELAYQDWERRQRAEAEISPKDTRTTVQKNAAALGLEPGSAEYAAYIRQATASPGTNVTIHEPGENYPKPFDKALAEADVQLFSGAREQAFNANNMLQSVQSLEDVLSTTDTGKPQEFYGRMAQYFGAPEGATFQAQQALVNKQVNEILNAAKGPQTEGDAQRARDQIPNMGTDPRARKVVFDFIRKGAQSRITEFQAMQEHLNQHGNLQGYQPTYGAFRVDASPVGGSAGKPGVARLRFNMETGEFE